MEGSHCAIFKLMLFQDFDFALLKKNKVKIAFLSFCNNFELKSYFLEIAFSQ